MSEELKNTLENVARCLAQEAALVDDLKAKRTANPAAANILDPLIELFEGNCASYQKWKSELQKTVYKL